MEEFRNKWEIFRGEEENLGKAVNQTLLSVAQITAVNQTMLDKINQDIRDMEQQNPHSLTEEQQKAQDEEKENLLTRKLLAENINDFLPRIVPVIEKTVEEKDDYEQCVRFCYEKINKDIASLLLTVPSDRERATDKIFEIQGVTYNKNAASLSEVINSCLCVLSRLSISSCPIIKEVQTLCLNMQDVFRGDVTLKQVFNMSVENCARLIQALVVVECAKELKESLIPFRDFKNGDYLPHNPPSDLDGKSLVSRGLKVVGSASDFFAAVIMSGAFSTRETVRVLHSQVPCLTYRRDPRYISIRDVVGMCEMILPHMYTPVPGRVVAFTTTHKLIVYEAIYKKDLDRIILSEEKCAGVKIGSGIVRLMFTVKNEIGESVVSLVVEGRDKPYIITVDLNGKVLKRWKLDNNVHTIISSGKTVTIMYRTHTGLGTEDTRVIYDCYGLRQDSADDFSSMRHLYTQDVCKMLSTYRHVIDPRGCFLVSEGSTIQLLTENGSVFLPRFMTDQMTEEERFGGQVESDDQHSGLGMPSEYQMLEPPIYGGSMEIVDIRSGIMMIKEYTERPDYYIIFK